MRWIIALVIGLVALFAVSCTTGGEDEVASTTSTVSVAAVEPFTPGAAGIGDAYYPLLGNGGYDVRHYDLDFAYNVDGTVDADVIITAVATQNLSEFDLDFVGWQMDALAVDGVDAPFSRDGEELVISPSRIESGDPFTVEIAYNGSPEPKESVALPLPVGWFTGPNGEQFVVAEPDAGHSWFPSNDHPLDKATFSFAVTVPTGYLGAANGELVAATEGDTTTTYHWEMTYPMAPYLATVVVGDGWRIVEDPVSTEAAGVAVRNILPPDLVDTMPPALEETGEMILTLEEAFGPYPFDRYGIAVVDGFGSALENQTLSVFGRSMVEAPFFEYVLVHELAHQWFGDSVSLAQWRDIWLNEGFATYAELLWVEHLHGAAAYREEVANRTEAALVAGYGPPGTPPPGDLFNGCVYQRGGLLLAALRDEIGDDDFFVTLRTYAGRFADGNVTTDDFIGVAEEVSGTDLGAFFDEWLYGEHLPEG